MPRAQSRDTRSTLAPVGDAEIEGVLHVIVTGLIARLEAAPLMRRPPAQCTPEEQVQLMALLSDLAEVRASQAALSLVPALSLSLVDGAWPELASLLATTGRTNRRAAPAPDGSGELAPLRSDTTQTGVADTLVPEPEAPHPTAPEEVAFAGASAPAAAVPVPAPPLANGLISSRPPTTMTGGASGASQAMAGRDLRDQVRGVLRTDHRPWSGSRIAARVQEADPLVTKEEVYNTLHRHSDVFRRTGHGWELVAQ